MKSVNSQLQEIMDKCVAIEIYANMGSKVFVVLTSLCEDIVDGAIVSCRIALEAEAFDAT